jgi:SAM-dependent methyltransferase
MVNNDKQVDVKKYNRDYYENLYNSPEYSNNFSWDEFGNIYKELTNLIAISPNNNVIDFGCGNGELTFCLYKKYGCNITGIDYSKYAINIANENLMKLNKKNPVTKIKFINSNNDALPNFDNIDYVYFCDVLEHMYENEIFLVLNKIKSWRKNKNLRIVIHTDNDLFLKFVRPLLDIISIIFGVSSVEEIKNRNNWENERHVNLTNPAKLKKYVEKFEFKQIKLAYPQISLNRVEKQLGKMSRIVGFKNIVFYCVKYFSFLSPSFYAIYEYNEK